MIRKVPGPEHCEQGPCLKAGPEGGANNGRDSNQAIGGVGQNNQTLRSDAHLQLCTAD